MLDTSTSPGEAAAREVRCLTTAGANRSSAQLAFAGVQSRAHVKADAAHVLDDRACATDCARRPVERGKESVAGRVDLDSSKALEVATDDFVVTLEQIAPAPVAELTRSIR